jgi:hypothetical protein
VLGRGIRRSSAIKLDRLRRYSGKQDIIAGVLLTSNGSTPTRPDAIFPILTTLLDSNFSGFFLPVLVLFFRRQMTL